MIVPVLLAGGSGNRLWPLSRELYPKQCLALTHSEHSLVQKTLLRVLDCGLNNRPVVVCNHDHRFLMAQQLSELGIDADIVLEPAARNTAAAIALAALTVSAKYPAAQLLVLPADHLINDQRAFCRAIEQAEAVAQKGHLVTFGVVPSYAEPGYGYIEAQEYDVVSPIKAFHEKPDTETAESYLAAGHYYWNSGMFLFPVGPFLSELKTHEPEIFAAVSESVDDQYQDLDFIRAGESAFKKSPSISVDVAVMERTRLGMVVPYRGDWSDVGSWGSVYEAQDKDDDYNVTIGDVICEDSSGNYVHAESRLVAALGVRNLAIVDTQDALLVMDRDKGQDVKKIVARLKSDRRSEHRLHSRVFRPWGSVETMNIGEHYQVKHVMINPGASIAMQVHHHRAEHWIVVCGTAEVLTDHKRQTIGVNESIYIKVGEVHSLRNCGDKTLEIIEVQTGDYFGEDDVTRFTNNYIPGSGE